MVVKQDSGERRTLEQLAEHYGIERELADRLRASSRQERGGLYALVYDELFQRVPLHPQLTNRAEPHDVARKLTRQLRFLRCFLDRDTVFLEVGAGDCAVALAVARIARQVYAVDVSEEITRDLPRPSNFELILSDGCGIPLPPGSVGTAYSNQLMEHLHPDDAIEQLGNIYRALAPGGRYVCVTPNRLSGPHDISMYFDVVPHGFHLKEYTNRELRRLFKRVGFRRVAASIGARDIWVDIPPVLLIVAETILDRLPYGLRTGLARRLPFTLIRIIGTK